MYNFYESFEKMKFKDWIFLRFKSMKFLWTIKGYKKKKLFSQAVFFTFSSWMRRYWFYVKNDF